MLLVIDEQPHMFEPIRNFRERFGLQETFGVSGFQPKSYAGLGSIERAGADLNNLRRNILAAVPLSIPVSHLFSAASELSDVFEREMERINAVIGLRESEIGFAVAGFSDVLHAHAFAIMRALLSRSGAPDFEAIYTNWLNGTARIASHVIEYTYGDQVWGIQIVAHAYGRIGLIIAAPEITYYVIDPVLACPAEGFMTALLRDVCTAITRVLAP